MPDPVAAEAALRRQARVRAAIEAGETPNIIAATYAGADAPCMGDLVDMGWAEKVYAEDNWHEHAEWTWVNRAPGAIVVNGRSIAPGAYTHLLESRS
jgi:hypothetical protein